LFLVPHEGQIVRIVRRTEHLALGWITNIDFAEFDLDQPAGELTTNGHQRSLTQFLRKAAKRTLREAIVSYTSGRASVDRRLA